MKKTIIIYHLAVLLCSWFITVGNTTTHIYKLERKNHSMQKVFSYDLGRAYTPHVIKYDSTVQRTKNLIPFTYTTKTIKNK